MNKAELVAQQLLGGNLNKVQWGSAMYIVLVEGLSGGGVVDDTAKLQVLVDKAIAEGRKAIFFPHGTNGQYYVTALTNADQVVFFGDNASFVGGYTGEILQLGEGGVSQVEFDALVTDFNTLEAEVVTKNARYVVDYDPLYDLALDQLASTIYHDLGIFTIPTDKKWYVNNVIGTNNSVGNGILRAFSFDLTAGPNATGDSVRGAIGAVKGQGASDVKAIQGTAQGLAGHTGIAVGLVGEVIPGPNSGECYAIQLTCGNNTNAALIINPVNASGDVVSNGVRVRSNVGVATNLILFDDVNRTANIINVRDVNNTLAEIFRISSNGDINQGVAQASITMKNATRTFQFQAVTTGDYLRIIAGSFGDIIRFKGNGSTEFQGPAVFKNYLTGALPTAATYPNAFATFGPSKLPIYCDGTNWRKMSDDTIVT